MTSRKELCIIYPNALFSSLEIRVGKDECIFVCMSFGSEQVVEWIYGIFLAVNWPSDEGDKGEMKSNKWQVANGQCAVVLPLGELGVPTQRSIVSNSSNPFKITKKTGGGGGVDFNRLWNLLDDWFSSFEL